jgi:hypothetical protein
VSHRVQLRREQGSSWMPMETVMLSVSEASAVHDIPARGACSGQSDHAMAQGA